MSEAFSEEMKQVIFSDLAKGFNLTFNQFRAHEFIEEPKVQKILNHPVHIIDEEGNLSPSALIPFCEFGGNMSVMGVKTEHFHIPVCKSFISKIFNDQLCYELDPNKYKQILTPEKFKQGMKEGLNIYIDTNNDRQSTSRDTDFTIHLNTLGINIKISMYNPKSLI